CETWGEMIHFAFVIRGSRFVAREPRVANHESRWPTFKSRSICRTPDGSPIGFSCCWSGTPRRWGWRRRRCWAWPRGCRLYWCAISSNAWSWVKKERAFRCGRERIRIRCRDRHDHGGTMKRLLLVFLLAGAAQAARLTPADRYRLVNVTDPQISPDGKSIVCVVA